MLSRTGAVWLFVGRFSESRSRWQQLPETGAGWWVPTSAGHRAPRGTSLDLRNICLRNKCRASH
jgi:hypothetical protein